MHLLSEVTDDSASYKYQHLTRLVVAKNNFEKINFIIITCNLVLVLIKIMTTLLKSCLREGQRLTPIKANSNNKLLKLSK